MQQQQTSTVVAIFDDYSTAEKAARELADAGIPRESIDVKSNFMTGAAGRSGYTEHPHEGGISGFFHRLFGTDESDKDAGHYAEAVRRGSAVVSVTASTADIDTAVRILNENGAVDVDRRVAAYRESGYQQYDANAQPYSLEEAAKERDRLRNREGVRSIPVVEEDLQVGKRAVTRGGVRVYSRVVEKPVDEEITLREEHARVERRPVDRPLEPGEASRFKDQSIEVMETSEEPVVSKRTRVREEVVVGKETTERTEHIRDSVRHTEVKVDRIDAGAEGDYREDFRRDYESNYANSGVSYEQIEPAYEYGYKMARDPRYQGRSWTEVENDLSRDYTKSRPGSVWERIKGAVRYGWEKATNRRS